jgi:hypothetical protein
MTCEIGTSNVRSSIASTIRVGVDGHPVIARHLDHLAIQPGGHAQS